MQAAAGRDADAGKPARTHHGTFRVLLHQEHHEITRMQRAHGSSRKRNTASMALRSVCAPACPLSG